MRPTRALAGMTAALLTVALPLAGLTSPADAAAKKHHTVTVKGKEPKHNHFVMVGTVTPMYHNKVVFILMQPGGKGKAKPAGSVKTDAAGVFQVPIYGPKRSGEICWLAKVPATPGYATSYSASKICVTKF